MQYPKLSHTLAAVGAISIAIGACSDSNGPGKPNVDLVSCPPSTTGGDNLTRAFYIDSFPGSSLKSVTSYFSAVGTGDRTVALTARDGAFDGVVIGSDTVIISAVDGDTNIAATFDLGGNAVTLGSTVTFAYDAIADTSGVLFMETTTTNASCPVVQTEGAAPPLDTVRRLGLPILIRGKE